MTTLNYRVENSGVADKQRSIEIDGQTAIAVLKRLSVELLPVDHASGTITLDLPPDTEGFAEGAVCTVTITPEGA